MSLQGNRKKKCIVILITIFTLMTILFLFFKTKNKIITGADKELLKTLTYAEVADGEDIVEDTDGNVKFDAFFMNDLNGDGTQKKLRGTCKQIGKEDILYMNINILQGELRNAQIIVNENENTGDGFETEEQDTVGNIYLQGAILKDDEIAEDIVGANIKTIPLKSMSNKSKTITGKVHSGDYAYETRKIDALNNDLNAYSKINTVTLKGTYISVSGEEIEINKTVSFTVDWYGEIESEIPEYAYGKIENRNQIKDISTAIDEENKEFRMDFDLYVQETRNELILQDVTVKVGIPELNGNMPKSINVVSPNIEYEFYEDTKELNIYKGIYQGKLIDGVYNGNRINKFRIKMIYPLESVDINNIYSLQLDMPVEACYSGYNNNGVEGEEIYFENPIYSEIVTETISVRYAKETEYDTRVKVNIGKREAGENVISKERIQNLYNNLPNKEEVDSYTVVWNAEAKSKAEKYIIKQTKDGESGADQFIKSDGTAISMENISSNTGIYFYNVSNFLEETGEIKIYDDESNELVATFTKDNCNNYTSENPYMYEIPIRYVRVEATNVKDNSSVSIYNIKEIDDDYIVNNFTEEEFNNLKSIETKVSGYLGENYINTDTGRAIYKESEIVDNYDGDINLKIVKTEKNSENKISNIKFKLTGINYEDGRVLVTNSEGELEFKGLAYNQEYVLEEIGSNKYIKPDVVRFTVTDEKTITIHEGTVKSNQVITEADVPVAILNIEGIKNSIYNLEVSKVIRPENVGLLGVKYRLYGEKKYIGEYTTNENGIINIEGLYEYDSNQHTTNQYVLKEVSIPNGYAKASTDIKFRIENRPDGLKMVLTNGNINKQTVEGNTIKVEISAKKVSIPSFKLTNKNNETGEFLSGTKFAIYKVNGENDEIALDSNYNVVGIKEIIDGKEYYTLTTNESGEISADLREGLYKAIEIKTVDDKYDLSNNVYYFGVGISTFRESSKVEIKEIVDTIIKTEDGYIGYGSTNNADPSQILGMNLDVRIVKYDKEGSIIWSNIISGNGNEAICNFKGTSDGGIITYVTSDSENLEIGNETYNNIDSRFIYGIVIKYNSDGNIEWSTQLGSRNNVLYGDFIETDDNGFIKFGQFYKPKINIGSYTIKNKSDLYSGEYYDPNEDLPEDSELFADSVIVKYSSSGEIEWINTIEGKGSDNIVNTVKLQSGGYLVYCTSDSGTLVSKNEDIDLGGAKQNRVIIENGSSGLSGIILEYDSQGKLQKSISIRAGANSSVLRGAFKISKVLNTSDGGLLACGDFSGSIKYNDYTINTSNSTADGVLIKYSPDSEIEWIKTLSGDALESIEDIVEIVPDEYIIIGTYNGARATFGDYTFENTLIVEELDPIFGGGTNSYYLPNSITARINKDGNILSVKEINADKSSIVSSILKTNDNGYIIIGKSNNSNIKIDNYHLVENCPSFLTDSEDNITVTYNDHPFMLKFDASDGFEYGKFVNTIDLQVLKNNDNTYSFNYLDNKEMIEEKLSNSAVFEVLNKRKEFKISTKVENNEGGSISGADKEYYEFVKYGDSSTKEIKVIPNEGYEIGQITINGKSCDYTLNHDGSATIGNISNITENQEIIVTFVSSSQKLTINVKDNTGNPIKDAKFSVKNIESNEEKVFITNSEGKGVISADYGNYEIKSIDIPKDYESNYFAEFNIVDDVLDIVLQKLNKVTVHHYLKNRSGVYTTEKIAEDDVYLGKSGENYKVEPKLDLENYELVKNSSGEYIIPDGVEYSSAPAVGIYSENKEVIYYYEERQAILLVHHYNLGTNEKTYLGDNSRAEDQEYRGYKGEKYSVSNIPNYDASNPEKTLAEGYSLIDVAGNEEGIYEQNENIIYYYYDVESFEITTKVNKHMEVLPDGSETEVKGGTISGEGENPYEVVNYGGETTRDYIVTPDPGYEIVSIKVNGEDIEFTTDSNGATTLGYIGNIREDKEIEVFFDRFRGYVLVHYIDEETDKKLIPDEEISGYIGYNYTLEPSEKIPVYYENTRTEGPAVGTFKKEKQEVTFYFRLKNYEYKLEYYYDEEIDESRTEFNSVKYGTEVTLEDLIGKVNENVKSGFKFDRTINLPVVITEVEENNIIKILYTSDGVIDENKSTYTVEYYYDNVIDSDKTDRLSATIGDVIDTYVDKCIDGYTLVSTIGLGLVIDRDPSKNIIKIYYENIGTTGDLAEYVLEYYYDKVQDTSKRQTIKTLVGTEITKDLLTGKIEENMIEGYKLYSLINVPLIVSRDESENIIKIYYIKKGSSEGGGEGDDEDKRQDSNYIIQYYYDDVLKSSLTETIVSKVGTVITRESISGNIATNKIKDYRLSSIVNIPLTVSEDENKNIIKIKYVKKAEGDPDDGDDENDPRKSEYVVKYYYDDEIDNTKTETIIAFIGDVIMSYTDNCIEGYRLKETVGIPLIVDKDKTKNIIEVYYVKKDGTITDQNDKIGYKIEYYYDNILETRFTNRVVANENEIITEETIKSKIEKYKLDGYKFFTTNLPIVVNGEIDKNVVKVFYISEDPDNPTELTGYKIEYYYDNVLEESLTEAIIANKDLIITEEIIADKIEKNKLEGYKFFTTNLPIVVSKNVNENVVKIFYISDNPDNPIDVTGYKVQYYYDNVLKPNLTEVVIASKGMMITEPMLSDKITKNKLEGYKFFTTNLPIVVSEDVNENIVKIFYVKLGEGEDPNNPEKATGYKIQYYYDDELKPALTEAIVAPKDTQITEDMLSDKISKNTIKKYEFLKTNLPIVVSENINENVVKIYYAKEITEGYILEYYYDDIIDNTKTEKVRADINSIVQLEDLRDKIDNNVIAGYEFTRAETLPLEIAEDIKNNVIKIYYNKAKFEYSIEYYYNNVIDSSKTEKFEATYEDVITQDIISNRIDVNTKDGYIFNAVGNLPLTISENLENNVIKVYYLKQIENGYKVEYYYNGVIDNTKTELIEAEVGTTITTYTDKNIDGYKLLTVENLPLTVSENLENNVIKVCYIKDISEGYKLEYYYDDNVDNTKTEMVEANPGSVVTKELLKSKIDKNTIIGYEFNRSENLPLTVNPNLEENTIKIYYSKQNVNYKVEYYYDNVIDNNKTEINTAKYQDEITEYVDKNITGYKLEKVEGIPLKLDVNENTIKVYYIKDQFNYTVEYYYNNIKDDSKTEINTATYQDEITEYIDKNVTGYKFERTEGLPLTVSEISENNIIKVYYKVDIEQRKDISYTVEYYKDGEKQEVDTQVEKESVQVLEPDTLEVNKKKINIVDKYVGYRLDRIEPETIPDIANNGDIIKVYYVKDEFEYKVEYYYDNVKDNEKTETNRALYKDEITDYIDKNIVGYKLEKTENLPLEISENASNNTIKVYYTKDKFDYTVKYYYNGRLDESKTKTFKALYQTQITIEMVQSGIDENTLEGYRFYGTSDLPVISEKSENNKIQIYYLKDVENGYILEYYYNGKIDMSKTEVIEASIGDVISTYPDKNIDGYKLLTVVNFPLTVSEEFENNVIKVCYIKDVFGYTLEYYYNGKIDDTKTERIEAVVGEEITKDVLNEKIERNKIVGYGYENAENLPLIVNENIENNTIKIKYGLLDFYYEIQYYYDGKIDHNKTDILLAKYGDMITDYQDKNITGYTFDKVIGAPLKVTEDQGSNIIKVYYERAEFEYKVEYYFDGILDEDLTIIAKELYGEEIKEVPNKVKEGYKVEKTENLPLTISENKENNIIKVYYSEHISEIIVRYVDKNTGRDIADSVKLQDRVGRKFDISNLKKTFDMYLLLQEPEITIGTYTEEIQTFIYYYARQTNVIVKYLEKDDTPDDYSDNPVLTYIEDGEEKSYEYEIEGFVGASYTTEAKEIPEYSLVETTDNVSGAMSDITTIVIYYYAKNTSIKVQHIDEKADKILKEEVIEGKVGDVVETSPEEFEGYKLVREPENRNVVMKKDEVVIVQYYYKEISGGVLERHVDNISEKLLYSEHHEGEPGDKYKIDSKEFEGYDVVTDKLPQNAEGEMAKELITVTYYYAKKTKVIVQYIDKLTNTTIEELEINGYEGDEYNTEIKEFDGYELVEEPENKSGKMTIDTIYVKYYYNQKSEGVIEKHIDVKTNEVLEEKEHTGYVGDYYKIEAKEFEGYDIVEEKLPDNAEGRMTIEKIEVNYYYIKKSKVIVEYIDKTKNEIISKEEIEGHEGDTYKTEAKEFENYVLESEPDNNSGVMLRDEVITVKYYYKNMAGKVSVQHIDVKSDKLLEPETVYTGSEGDSYKTQPKEFEGYDLVKEHLPDNAEGTMGTKEIVVKYYYIRKTIVKVKYINIDTNDKLEEDTIISGHEEQKYITEAKDIKGYKLVNEKLPENREGYMTVDPIIVIYYYKLDGSKPDNPSDSDKPSIPHDNNDDKQNNSGNNNINNSSNIGNNSSNNPNEINNSSNNSNKVNNSKNEDTVKDYSSKEKVPYTGDNTPVNAVLAIIITIIVNIIQLVSKKNNKKFIK